MTELHPAASSDEELMAQCHVRRTRRRGPGGQHRNKVESAIVITHGPSGVSGEASERRSQHENRRVAMFRLRVNLALKVRCSATLRDSPSSRWRNRCVAGRIEASPDHGDFPALLAEALDMLAICEMNVSNAAQRLGVTPSQLVKFLKLEHRALSGVNQSRAALGMRPLL
jgi:hypothetical protein